MHLNTFPFAHTNCVVVVSLFCCVDADVYEVLGLPRPRTYNEARRITMAEIRNGYRTQLMKYHPDFYREDSTSLKQMKTTL